MSNNNSELLLLLRISFAVNELQVSSGEHADLDASEFQRILRSVQNDLRENRPVPVFAPIEHISQFKALRAAIEEDGQKFDFRQKYGDDDIYKPFDPLAYSMSNLERMIKDEQFFCVQR